MEVVRFKDLHSKTFLKNVKICLLESGREKSDREEEKQTDRQTEEEIDSVHVCVGTKN